MSDDLHECSAIEQGALLQRGELRAVDLTRHYLDRIDRANAEIGAFTTVCSERALVTAQSVDARRAGGEDLPLLAGVPVAVKALVDVAGVPTNYGSLAFVDHVPTVDAPVIERMERAGMVVIGQTNVPELGGCAYTESLVAPPARSPWNLSCSAGGSSGGAGAALAAGLIPLALGSDGAGSVRIPASVNGVVGLKVSRDRIGGGGSAADADGMVQHGPMGRTVVDVAALLDVLEGLVVGDAHAAPPPSAPFIELARRDPGRLRIARLEGNIYDAPVDPRCAAVVTRTMDALTSLGHQVGEVELPIREPLLPTFQTIWFGAFASLDLTPSQERVLTPYVRWMRERGSSVTAAQYLRALAVMQSEARAFLRATTEWDILVTPALAVPSVRVGELRDDDDPEADFMAQCRFTPFTALCNMTGQPAISVPVGQTDDGLPVGAQLIGRPWSEGQLLALASSLEAQMPWRSRRPALW